MKDIHQKLLATFEVEHRDHVEQIRSLMVAIGDAGAIEAREELDEVFRRAHSLKGAARAVDVHPIEKLAHRLETLFSRVRQGTCELDPVVNRVVQQVLDASEDCIASLATNQPSGTAATALEAIEGVLGMEKADSAEAVAETPAPAPVFQSVEMVRITSEHFDGLFRTAGGLVRESQLQDQVSSVVRQPE